MLENPPEYPNDGFPVGMKVLAYASRKNDWYEATVVSAPSRMRVLSRFYEKGYEGYGQFIEYRGQLFWLDLCLMKPITEEA